MSLLAGNGTGGYGGDGGLAVNAALLEPRGVHATSDGRVWIADAGNNRIRMVSRIRMKILLMCNFGNNPWTVFQLIYDVAACVVDFAGGGHVWVE